jgi:predicted TIM-barrel fold metal-dependent hydrolase
MSAQKPTTRVIAIEEAFLHPKMWELYSKSDQEKFAPVKDALSDVGEARIRRMDAAGIDMQVLSHVQPGVQTIKDPDLAIKLSKEVNDWLGEVVRTHPDRFAGFAMLPTQSPKDAADELDRTVKELGFKGALINGHTNGKYLDDETFSVLFERAEALDVPIYIHPTDPPETISNLYYHNDTALITGWGWSIETGTHLLRMMTAGVFDRYPRLKIIVGHMGELLPYCMTRLNVALTMGEELLAVQEKKATGVRPLQKMEKNVISYMRNNVFVTTSGVFDQPVFECALAVLGLDNLLFSVDDPFQDNFEGIEFLNATRLSLLEKEQFAHGNAERLLKLPVTDGSRARSRQSLPQNMRSSIFAFNAKAKSKMRRTLISLLVK